MIVEGREFIETETSRVHCNYRNRAIARVAVNQIMKTNLNRGTLNHQDTSTRRVALHSRNNSRENHGGRRRTARPITTNRTAAPL